jgi:hypothetical protein
LPRTQELAAKHRRERFNREEKASPGCDPATIGVKCSAGHQRVHVRVMGERLPPGMQHQRGGDIAPEPARVLAKLDQRFRSRGKQQPVDPSRVALGQRIDLVREREHQMEIGHGQELSAPALQPTLLGERLALRAVAVAARVVVKLLRAAMVALGDVAAQLLRATALDGAQRLQLGSA